MSLSPIAEYGSTDGLGSLAAEKVWNEPAMCLRNITSSFYVSIKDTQLEASLRASVDASDLVGPLTRQATHNTLILMDRTMIADRVLLEIATNRGGKQEVRRQRRESRDVELKNEAGMSHKIKGLRECDHHQ